MAKPIASSPPSPPAMPLAAPPDESPARVRELAHEFEAMFLAQMLKQMRQSMTQSGENDEGDGFGKAAFTDTFDTELARHLSSSGGLGIARIIIEAFERREGTSTGPTGSSGSPGWVDPPGSPVPAVAGAPASPPPASTSPELPGPVSSAFGWRRDPLTGQGRFHRGVDVRAAYGQPVPSVAGGTVVAAGSQGGYGLTVVIEHDSGIRTRYAHLSAIAVQAGEGVSRGQDIGRVGSTGRSTGPHLHFEVLEGGRPVNPVVGLRKLGGIGGFTEVGAVADSSIGGASAMPASEE